jgi:actin-related protein 6
MTSDQSRSGLEQCGLADTIAASISLLPVDLQGMFWANIGLIGGNTRFPGFRQRLYVSFPICQLRKSHFIPFNLSLTEVQSHVPGGYEVVIYECDE